MDPCGSPFSDTSRFVPSWQKPTSTGQLSSVGPELSFYNHEWLGAENTKPWIKFQRLLIINGPNFWVGGSDSWQPLVVETNHPPQCQEAKKKAKGTTTQQSSSRADGQWSEDLPLLHFLRISSLSNRAFLGTMPLIYGSLGKIQQHPTRTSQQRSCRERIYLCDHISLEKNGLKNWFIHFFN